MGRDSIIGDAIIPIRVRQHLLLITFWDIRSKTRRNIIVFEPFEYRQISNSSIFQLIHHGLLEANIASEAAVLYSTNTRNIDTNTWMSPIVRLQIRELKGYLRTAHLEYDSLAIAYISSRPSFLMSANSEPPSQIPP